MQYSKKSKIPLAVVMLGFVSLFTDAATEMIYPLVPVFVASLGSGAIVLGFIEGIAETTSSLLKLFSGILSDKTGKRKILVAIGYAISSFIRPLTGIVTDAWQIIFVRMFDRVGKGIRTAPRDALIAASVPESIRGKSYGFHRSMDHAGAVIGPFIAIIILFVLFTVFNINDSVKALRLTFLFALIPGILSVLTIVFFVNEGNNNKISEKKFRFSLKNFDRNFIFYLLVIIIFTLGNSSDAFLLFRAGETINKSKALFNIIKNIRPLNDLVSAFGNTESQVKVVNILFLPVIWAFFHIIKVIFSTPLGALSDRVGRKIVINIGWGIYTIVYMGFALIVFLPADFQITATFILFAIYALFYAFSEGAEKAFVADLVNAENKGSAFGMYNFAVGLSALPASIIFGFLYSFFDLKFPGFGGTVAFGFGALLALTSMLLMAFIVKEPNKEYN